MFSAKSKVPVFRLHDLPLGKRADTFVLLAERRPGKTRENKPYLAFTLKSLRRTVSAVVWGTGTSIPSVTANGIPAFSSASAGC